MVGSVQAVAAIEWMLDHISHYLKKDPIQVRLANMLESGDALIFGAPTYERHNLIPEMIENMKTASEYEARKAMIEKFNKVEYYFNIFKSKL